MDAAPLRALFTKPCGVTKPCDAPPPTEEQWLPLYAEDVHVQDPPFSVMRWLYKRSVA